MWVPGIELRSVGLVLSIFTGWVMSDFIWTHISHRQRYYNCLPSTGEEIENQWGHGRIGWNPRPHSRSGPGWVWNLSHRPGYCSHCHTLTLTSWDSCTPCCCPTSITLSLVTSSGLAGQRLYLSPDQWGHRRHQNRILHASSPCVLLSVTSNSLGTAPETSQAPEQSSQMKQRTTSDSHINTDEFFSINGILALFELCVWWTRFDLCNADVLGHLIV